MSDAFWTAFWNNTPQILTGIGMLYGAWKARQAANASKTAVSVVKDVKETVAEVDRKTEAQTVVIEQTAANTEVTKKQTDGQLSEMRKALTRVAENLSSSIPGGKRASDPPLDKRERQE